MLRLFSAIVMLFVVSCTPEEPPTELPTPAAENPNAASTLEDQVADAGQQVRLVPKIYWIEGDARSRIPHRVLDAVNAIRSEKGLSEVALSKELTAAARTHARDMSIQNRPWHFGSDGSSPISRAAKAGYEGTVLGENISESFESDLETMVAWMQNPQTRSVILEAGAAKIGIGWHQESEGKIWWTLVVGT